MVVVVHFTLALYVHMLRHALLWARAHQRPARVCIISAPASTSSHPHCPPRMRACAEACCCRSVQRALLGPGRWGWCIGARACGCVLRPSLLQCSERSRACSSGYSVSNCSYPLRGSTILLEPWLHGRRSKAGGGITTALTDVVVAGRYRWSIGRRPRYSACCMGNAHGSAFVAPLPPSPHACLPAAVMMLCDSSMHAPEPRRAVAPGHQG